MTVLYALMIAAQAVAGQADAGTHDAALIANCNARKFETVVYVMTEGKPRSSKVKLCGQVGQSDADWLRTLTDAIDKISANPKMSASVKQQIVSALKLEIAKLPVASELLQMPAPSIAVVKPAPPLTIGSTSGARVEYSTLPPMPAPKAAAVAGVMSAVPSLPPPRLTLNCLATDTLGVDGPCDTLARGMLVTVRADEDLPAGTSLRFLRRGDDRGEVGLAVLRRGQSQRFALPAKVCSGVSGSRVEIQVVRSVGSSPQVVDTRGPFELRC
jgi:hypothetical protein